MVDALESLSAIRARRFRRVIIIVTCVVVVVGPPCAWFGPRLYSRWQQGRLVRQAQELVDQGNPAAAVGRLQRVLGFNPEHLEAARLMAKVADEVGAPQAPSLHKRVCQLQPGSFEDAAAWAAAAFEFGNSEQAAEALALMRKARPDDPLCHEAAGKLAARAGRNEEAAAEFDKALQVDPGNKQFQLEAAANALSFQDKAGEDAARQKLEALAADPKVRLAALRVLAMESQRRNRMNDMLALSARLANEPGASFDDQLVYLSAMQTLRVALFSSRLTEIEKRALGHPADIAALMAWMNSHSLAMVSAEWARTLPPDVASKPPVAVEAARSSLLVLDWKTLRILTGGGNWGAADFLRQAFLSRALRETGDARGSENHWNDALILAAKQPEQLVTLERFAASWDWQFEREELLWRVSAVSEKPRLPLETLSRIYSARADTHQLLRVWTSLRELDPGDAKAENNWAMLSLLLGVDVENAGKAAADLAAKHAGDREVVTTYALALQSGKHTDAALKAMRTLKPEELESPRTAAVYGELLAAKGLPDAKKYLALAGNARLLPEEEDLVAQARHPAETPLPQPSQQAMIQLPSQIPDPSAAPRQSLIELPSQLPALPPKPAVSPIKPQGSPGQPQASPAKVKSAPL